MLDKIIYMKKIKLNDVELMKKSRNKNMKEFVYLHKNEKKEEQILK